MLRHATKPSEGSLARMGEGGAGSQALSRTLRGVQRLNEDLLIGREATSNHSLPTVGRRESRIGGLRRPLTGQRGGQGRRNQYQSVIDASAMHRELRQKSSRYVNKFISILTILTFHNIIIVARLRD